MAQFLLDHGAKVDQCSGPNQLTPLALAIQNDDHRMVGFLINSKADVSKACGKGNATPLMRAAKNNLTKIGSILISKGAKVDELQGKSIPSKAFCEMLFQHGKLRSHNLFFLQVTPTINPDLGKNEVQVTPTINPDAKQSEAHAKRFNMSKTGMVAVLLLLCALMLHSLPILLVAAVLFISMYRSQPQLKSVANSGNSVALSSMENGKVGLSSFGPANHCDNLCSAVTLG
jgi:hypothetical protein